MQKVQPVNWVLGFGLESGAAGAVTEDGGSLPAGYAVNLLTDADAAAEMDGC